MPNGLRELILRVKRLDALILKITSRTCVILIDSNGTPPSDFATTVLNTVEAVGLRRKEVRLTFDSVYMESTGFNIATNIIVRLLTSYLTEQLVFAMKGDCSYLCDRKCNHCPLTHGGQ